MTLMRPQVACEIQLILTGLVDGAFVLRGGRAFFKQGSRDKILAAQQSKRGSTLDVAVHTARAEFLRILVRHDETVRNLHANTMSDQLFGAIRMVLNMSKSIKAMLDALQQRSPFAERPSNLRLHRGQARNVDDTSLGDHQKSYDDSCEASCREGVDCVRYGNRQAFGTVYQYWAHVGAQRA